MSLVAGWFPVTVVVVAIVATLAIVPWEQRVRWRVLTLGLVAAAVLTGVTVAVVRVTGLVPWSLPWSFAVVLGFVLLGPALTVAAWRHLRWRRAVPVAALAVSLLAAGALVNAQYAYFPTWRSLLGTPSDQTDLAAVRADRDHDVRLRHGLVVEVAIPGTVSHFAARDAWVWLPPAYLDDHDLHLPVVELLDGSPSNTLDWIRGGGATETADAYARDHAGVAPLVVMPDSNGSETADTECVDSPRGHVETYLTVDVPRFMAATFDARTGPGSTAVAGLSEGGTCSIVLALRHPTEFTAFGDFSGDLAPSVTQGLAPARTTRDLFGGSWAAYEAHDPVHLLRTQHYPHLTAFFESGTADPESLAAQRLLAPLAQAAGARVEAVEVPDGGHTFTLWTEAFRDALPWLGNALFDGAHLPEPAPTP